MRWFYKGLRLEPTVRLPLGRKQPRAGRLQAEVLVLVWGQLSRDTRWGPAGWESPRAGEPQRHSVASTSPLYCGPAVLFQVRLDVLLCVCLLKKVTDTQQRPGWARARRQGNRWDAHLLVRANTLRGSQHWDLPGRSGGNH